MNAFKSSLITVLIGVPWRSNPWNPKAHSQIRNDVHVYLNTNMPGWHHYRVLDKPVRQYSMPQEFVNQHKVTVEVFYRLDELKRPAALNYYPKFFGCSKAA